jgi:hypothetical protein
MSDGSGSANLMKVDDIVVLMLERAPATDLEVRIAAASRELRRLGHPEGQP